MCNQQSLRSACAYAQSNQSLCLSLEYFMSVKLLTKHLLEVLSLKGGCTGPSESTLVKISNCWKSHAAAQIFYFSELDNNEFRFLHQYPFANLQNLAILHLGTNHIDIIPEKAFENCTSLSEM